MDLELVAALSDGQFHSGPEIGHLLGVSRAAISKRLTKIERETGLVVERVSGKGVRLQYPLSLLDQSILSARADELGWDVRCLGSVDSTNSECLRELPIRSCSKPLMVIAEYQSGGRGRRGREWISPAFQNICLSLLLPVKGGGASLSTLSLVVGLAIVDVLRSLGLTKVGVKWPNDVYSRGKKIAGVLLELVGNPMDVCHLVIGIGLNVNMRLPAEKIDQPWTSILLEATHKASRPVIACMLMSALHAHIERFFKEGFAGFRDDWEASNIWAGQICQLSTPGGEPIQGEVLGIGADGALRMKVGAEVREFSAGELSLRGYR